MPDKKNALADLAVDANLLILDKKHYSSYESFIKACETKNKVVLILNELSNVKFEGSVSKDGNGIVSPSVTMRPKIDSLIDKFYKAIDIAEQGERDGK